MPRDHEKTPLRKESRHNRPGRGPITYCDLTQSWSERGGGVRTYLMRKREHILAHDLGRHVLIIPGAKDEVIEEGSAVTVTIASPHVPGSPNYRLLLRNKAVREALERFSPDLIECQDCYNLPWAAIGHKKRRGGVALTASYMTDFPTVYLGRPLSRFIGPAARGLARMGYAYVRRLFRNFDAIGALSEAGGAAKLRDMGVERVAVTPLGVEVEHFSPAKRDPELRGQAGVKDGDPLLIYVGRLDKEKKPDVVVEAFRKLPKKLGARLVLLGDGPLRQSIKELNDERILMPGFVSDRETLARWLASADIYVSGMADETFGVSIVEAQASGLPVVGVAAGAMVDRVPDTVGRLGAVGDSAAMARNIQSVWNGDRSAMAAAARKHALGFSWKRSMEILFGDVYPKALERARARVAS